MNVFLDTVGCRLNQAEIEGMASGFRAAGHQIVADPALANLAVINTCAVTAQAVADSRSAIRRLGRAGHVEIVATGCWASLYPGAAAGLPGVERIVLNADKDRLVSGVLGLPDFPFEQEPIAREPLPGLRQRTRAFIKVQDGCDSHCTFCVTTIARGKARSHSRREVLLDIQAALAGGAQEVVLTGVQLGSWGRDLGAHLRELIGAILVETGVRRLRLSSVEPWDLDQDFFSLWEDPRLCRHFHLPLQSGCRATLKRMARKATPDSFKSLVMSARRLMPDVAITTDIIAGFPGETQAEFQESLEFVREMEFAGGHVFTFSPRAGTAAARLPDSVPAPLAHERNAIYRELLASQSAAFRREHVGRTVDVLWEATTVRDGNGWQLEGLTGNYLRVRAWASAPRWNLIDPVRLTGLSSDSLNGVIRKTG